MLLAFAFWPVASIRTLTRWSLLCLGSGILVTATMAPLAMQKAIGAPTADRESAKKECYTRWQLGDWIITCHHQFCLKHDSWNHKFGLCGGPFFRVPMLRNALQWMKHSAMKISVWNSAVIYRLRIVFFWWSLSRPLPVLMSLLVITGTPALSLYYFSFTADIGAN